MPYDLDEFDFCMHGHKLLHAWLQSSDGAGVFPILVEVTVCEESDSPVA